MDLDTRGFDSAEEVKGDLPPVPGTYLCVVKACAERPVKKNGDPINGMRLTLEIVDGTVPGQEGRSLEQMLWYTKDGGGPTPVHVRLAMALKLIGGKQKRSVDFDGDAPGRFLFVRIVDEEEQRKDEATGKWTSTGKKQPVIGPAGRDRGMDVWPISSPECTAIAQLPGVARVLTVIGQPSEAVRTGDAPTPPQRNGEAESRTQQPPDDADPWVTIV